MINLEILFKDLFDGEKITNERLGTFGFDHLAKLTANNPGSVFNSLITATQTKLVAFSNAYQLKGSNIGDQKGSTNVKNDARKAFTQYIREQEGGIRTKFGKTSAAYMQFFPDGLSAFNKATDSGYYVLVNNIVARANQYIADLGVPFRDAVVALATAYGDAELAQNNEKGDVSNARDGLLTERSDLTLQLTTNVLTIALQFLGQPEKERIYFNTSLLFAQHRKHIYKGEPGANATVTVTKIVYEAGKLVKMVNKGATELTFQMYLQGNAIGDSFTVAAGGKDEKKMSDFFTNADALKVTNNGNLVGQYVVELIA